MGDAIHQDWENDPRVEILHVLDQINQPYSCNQWGDGGLSGCYSYSNGAWIEETGEDVETQAECEAYDGNNDGIADGYSWINAIPPIIIGESSVFFNLFQHPGDGASRPLVVFINHEMEIIFISDNHVTQTDAYDLINFMLEAIPESGCMDETACNYNSAAEFDDGSCLAALDGVCESCSGEQDGSGTIVDNDTDSDGICDNVDDCIGVYDECGICDGPGSIYECGCADIPEDDCDCFGNVLDECGVCGGPGATDECNCDGIAEGTCDCFGNVLDECGVCDGPGSIYECGCADIPVGDCDCLGNVLDTCGVCGGNGLSCLGINGLVTPDNYSISNIYPNPFNPTTNIKYELPENNTVKIVVYDLNGKIIQHLVNEFQTTGIYTVTWKATGYPSGLYFIHMQSGSLYHTRKVVLLK